MDSGQGRKDSGLDARVRSGLDARVQVDAASEPRPRDAGRDASFESCDLAACPDPNQLYPGHEPPAYEPGERCCSVDGCGITHPEIWPDGDCYPLVSGTPSAACPDFDFNGQHLQGCCTAEAECGHVDAKLGCHGLFNSNWADELRHACRNTDDAGSEDAGAFEPFACSHKVCRFDWECCTHPNYSTYCYVPSGKTEGYCDYNP